MAQIKPLRLKSQKSRQRPEIATEAPVAQVLVFHSVFHLDGTYDYLVPQNESITAAVGTLVKVDFSGREVQGYIVNRREFDPGSDSLSKLKYLDGVISSFPILTQPLRELLSALALRYGSSILELLPAALPDRSASAERTFRARSPRTLTSSESLIHDLGMTSIFSDPDKEKLRSETLLRISVQLSAGISAYQAITQILELRSQVSHTLIVVPDQKDIELLSLEIQKRFKIVPLILGTHQSKSQRYLNFLIANLESPTLILGTRSSIFTSLPKGSSIIVLDDLDESMYDKRAPGWNVRDVALLRAAEYSLIFVSYFPALEISRLVSTGWMQAVVPQRRIRPRITFDGGHRSYSQTIHDGLRFGSVLVTTSTPGYINGFLCQKCRNTALCTCGGKLHIDAPGKAPSCSLCSKNYLNWSCTWCGESKIRMVGRGAGRIAQELGKAFPGVQVISSTSAHRIDIKPEGRVLSVATLGCEPDGEYAAGVFLDGELNFNRVELRSDEIALSRWLRASSLVKDDGEIFLSLEGAHPVAQAISSRNFELYIERALSQRQEVRFPPFYRMATIQGPQGEISRLFQLLHEEERFEILGPIPTEGETSKLILRAEVTQGQNLSDFLLDLRRLRSIKALAPLSVRIDPYAI